MEFIKLSLAYSKQENRKRYQYGGTVTFCFNQNTYRTFNSRCDTFGLDRWSWLRMKIKIKKIE